MSYLESPKSRFTSIAATMVAAASSAHSTPSLQPGCVQCGRLLDGPELRRTSFSGKCYACEHWGFDEVEDFDELEG